MFSFNSQINNIDYKKEYTIQITTDNYEQFKFMQDMARECVDGMHNEDLADWFKEYDVINPLIIDKTSTSIPDACKNCSNHPSNGGSGICNCTLGLPTVK